LQRGKQEERRMYTKAAEIPLHPYRKGTEQPLLEGKKVKTVAVRLSPEKGGKKENKLHSGEKDRTAYGVTCSCGEEKGATTRLYGKKRRQGWRGGLG